MKSMTDADIELQHLWLEIQTQRWQNVSRFLFSYYCYKNNLVNKNNKVCWETARDALPASICLKTRKQAVIEPLIPEETVVGLLKAISKDGEMTFDVMTATLNAFLHYVVIRKQEKLQLKPNMPASWYQQHHKPVFARFEQAGIEIQQIK
ncbi:hypothetical protein GOZ66_17150 [Vibrio parahaemolyticus]|nr:hypothetical protein [Vibrio parahaemolyticus]OOQ78328.1 hypothetical protein BSR65_16400 [Vibrio parahaemolyticus]PMT72569.1 hypothetical protein C1S93_06155 [Vibrio parahaemolyticus]TNZ91590.1 hypothetical protein CGK40_19075 [Vibrio parahaemolyticus]TOH10983.1 hypothetical protein CGI90_18655 [Vibrio parahaemolyticus]